jgi:hypothetical protein
MSLAKRLEERVREHRLSEEKADEILRQRAKLWAGQEDDGQMLMFCGDRDADQD